MRIVCFLVLTCAFPFIALSQIPPDKAIIDDYAHPRLAALLKAGRDNTINTAIIENVPGVYLVSATSSLLRQPAANMYVVLRQLSPEHAIVALNTRITPAHALKLFRFIVPANNAWKLSPALLKNSRETKRNLQLSVYVSDNTSFINTFRHQLTVLQEYVDPNILRVQLHNPFVLDTLIASDLLLFADLAYRPVTEELSVSGFDLGTNAVNSVHHYFPGLTGEGLMVSVKENRFDSNDTDLKGRVVSSAVASPTQSGHATIMATMIAGAGNSFYDGKGVAYKSGLQSASFSNLMPESEAFYKQQGISVQNHSYGTGVENFYGADAAAYDAIVADNPVLMHVFSSGNSGLLASNGPYTGITGFANLTGSFKMAKNILTVGATDSTGNIELPSSRGPAYDGRIKPELAAFGQDGSSGAAAIVSGISLLLQQAYRQLHHDSLPPAALLKSILINTADDVGVAGPDFASGYGKANAYRAVHSILQSHFFTGSIQQGNAQTFSMDVPAGIASLKLTLAWTDPAASANTLKALVNDLDLELVHISSGQTWRPWVLSSYPHKDSLQLLATRGKDTLNNVEQITLEAPLPGEYNIVIKANRVTPAGQQYFVAYHADTANTFQWMFPMPADPVEGGTSVIARWHATFNPGTTGTLQYSLPNGVWQTAADNVDLGKNYVRWNAPDTFSTAVLRMVTGSGHFTTDSFVISKLINTQVGFNCPDSFLFYWRKPPGVSSFRIYELGSKFLEPVTVTQDTFYLAAKSSTGSKQFTIAPIINNKEGFKAYAFDYTLQGVDCYFKSFLAQLNANQARLQLQLGSVHGISSILLQKLSGAAFNTLQTIDAPSLLQFDLTDASLNQGANIYRVALQLQDGRIIYSNMETVYYLNTTAYLIYPNPASINGGFKILQQEPSVIRVLMHDAAGRLVKDETHQDLVVTVNTLHLQKGLYFVTIVKDDKNVFRGKIVIGR